MYSVVRFFPVLLLVKNQAAGNSRPSIVYFLKAETVRREITIKANFVGARPIKIVPQSVDELPADGPIFQTGAQSFLVMKNQSGTGHFLSGQDFPYLSLSSVLSRPKVHSSLQGMVTVSS